MTTIIQNTWNEEDDQELLEYLGKEKPNYRVLDRESILKLNPLIIEVLFASTDIIQKILPNVEVPNTYPDCFTSLYHRNIRKIKLQECVNLNFPFFVKPYDNNKSFMAIVVRNDNDLTYVMSQHVEYVYISDVVEFTNEYRIFLQKGKIWGIQESSDFILDENRVNHEPPPVEIVRNICELNTFEFCVVDVGLTSENNWCVVEVNPAFALTSYNLDIDKYFNYCKACWEFNLVRHISFENTKKKSLKL